MPISDIKQFIIGSRQKGYTDPAIIKSLQEAKWPQDIIDKAIREANEVIQPVQEKVEVEKPKEKKKEKVEEEKPKGDDLFTKAPIEKGEKPEEKPKKEKKKFSFFSIIAFLLSPIPIIGLAIAMAALDSVRKNKMKGTLICLFALIINIAATGYLLWMIFRIFSLEPEKLSGAAKYLNDVFGLV